ncbi:MAG: penicillin-binding transpeptidase domain-containing protein [bacterium]|nr:penicillin-binding transpeptidase domain-containing protein [bacterium]
MIPKEWQHSRFIPTDSEYRLRLRWMVIVILLLATIGIGRYGFWLFVRGDEIRNIATEQYRQIEPIASERGRIYDRNGNILVSNIKYVTIGVDRQTLKITIDSLASILAKSFGKPASFYRDRINKIDQRYVVLEKRITIDIASKIDKYKIAGLVKTIESSRYYPNGTCAAMVIGKVDNTNNGIFGLERSLNKQLAGIPGKQFRIRIGSNASTIDIDNPIVPAVNGADIYTSLDVVAQQIVEEELSQTVEEFKAQSGTVVVMVPQTGEIIAMASYPFFDPNKSSAADTLGFRPRPVYDLFEPGSTAKTFTFAAVLENTNTSLDEIINTYGGSYSLCGKVIHDDHHSGPLSVADAFAQSSNIVTLQLGLRMRPETFREAFKKFGFVARSHSGLPAEQPGMMPSLSSWSSLSQATISYGHGISVTALQLTQGYAALANGGELMWPQLVKRIDWNDKLSDTYEPMVRQRAVSRQTAETMLMLMQRVTEVGTGKRARIDGIKVGGKTGTAKKLSERGGYMEGHYVANYVGVAPIDNPQLVCAVVIDDPRAVSHYGGIAAAPLWQRIIVRLMQTLPAMAVQSAPVRYVGNTPTGYTVPELIGMSDGAAQRLAQGWVFQREGSGDHIIAQEPAAGMRVTNNTIRIVLADERAQLTSIPVPPVYGMSLRNALAKLSELKLTAEVQGVGKVLTQNPAPGTILPCGSTIQLICERAGL